MDVMITLEERLTKATARAEAAAARCEKLSDLLEMKLAQDEESTDALERIDAQEAAIIEIAEIIGGEE